MLGVCFLFSSVLVLAMAMLPTDDLCPGFPPLTKPLILPRKVLVWTWTKNTTDAGLLGSLQYLREHKGVFSTVSSTSFCFDEKPDGTVDLGFVILKNGTKLTQGDYLKQAKMMGYSLMPLVYEDRTLTGGLLAVLRRLFANPTPFFTSALKYVKEYGLDGFNVDFETTEFLTERDHWELNMFLDAFAALMRAVGKELTLDVNNDFPIFNHTLLSRASLNKFILMDTYYPSLDFFVKDMGFYLQHYPPTRIGMGFMSCGYNTTELYLRLSLAAQLGIAEVDIWAAPLPGDWPPYFKSFLEGNIV